MQGSKRSSQRWGLAAAGAVALLALAGLFGFRNQLPLLFAPAATPTKVQVSSTVVATVTPEPTFTPTTIATFVQGTPRLVPPAGNSSNVALLSVNDLYLMNPDWSELTLVRTENSPKSNLHWIAGGRLIYMSHNCAFMLDSTTNRVQQLTCFNPNES